MRFVFLIGLILSMSANSSIEDKSSGVQPKLKNNVSAYGCKKAPRFPIDAIKKRIEGWAVVEFSLNDNGYPLNMKIIDSHPKGYFEKSALESLSSCKFKPLENAESNYLYSSRLDFKFS
jgi:TonB family protein